MTSKAWSIRDIPDQSGKLVVVTGANSGIGFETALVLAGKGAHVILACRTGEKSEAAARKIVLEYPNAIVESMPLDLADLASVRAFAESYKDKYDTLDLLINNAGVMAIPRGTTKDGFEMQFGTNHLGHFALSGLLFEVLAATPGARVVTVSSNAHKGGKMRFKDLQSEKQYGRWTAYNMSKLANLLFCYELARKISARNLEMLSVAAHPGFTETNLFVSPRMENSKLISFIYKLSNELIAQDVLMGSLPTLYAATAAEVNNGDYFGPAHFRGWRGPPVQVKSNWRSRSLKDAKRLWSVSEELTSVKWPI